MSSNKKIPEPTDKQGRLSVLIEFRQQQGASAAFVANTAATIESPGFEVDNRFEPVRMGGSGQGLGAAGSVETFIVRGTVAKKEDMDALRKRPDVVEVWMDTPIAPFAGNAKDAGVSPQDNNSMAPCPIPPCDCAPNVAKGNMADVAAYLGVDQVWTAGFRGTGIVVGVVDGGITAQGRPVKAGETARRIGRVIGGWPAVDWGTEASQWGEHGNMCSTDVLGMAPEAQIYDLRISGGGGSPGTISRALQAFQWAIDRHRLDGTPQVLSNSWGIFQETWDATYARNPNHPFTRKVVEAINEGILVLFAAGNCGSTCPDGRCGPDNGPGRSIWGANSHPMVMTVGAVNKNEQFIGYSSQGPGALDPQKPDFCGISHFQGYFGSDSGTSAATPIIAGLVALIKQANPAVTQDQVKNCLKATAKDIGPAGFDQHSGSGIVQGKAAFDRCRGGTLPVIDTNPVADRITSLPVVDRRITNAILDHTTPIADRIRTLPAIDRRPTTPISDLTTVPAVDTIGTVPAIDRPQTVPVLDQGTNPAVDFRKIPGRDTIQEGIIRDPRIPVGDPIGGQGVYGQGVYGQGGYAAESPFVLATPHQASDWQTFDQAISGEYGGDAGSASEQIAVAMQQLADAIAAQQAQLAELQQHYELAVQQEAAAAGYGQGGGYSGGGCTGCGG
jgi:Subtilase family